MIISEDRPSFAVKAPLDPAMGTAQALYAMTREEPGVRSSSNDTLHVDSITTTANEVSQQAAQRSHYG